LREKVGQTLTNNDSYASGINSYDNYKNSYFDNLTYNFGMNYKGSCGYVAIAMLLSYYDTYLNDNIIAENFDVTSIGQETNMINRRNSPGIMKDIICNERLDANYGFDLSAYDYYYHITAMKNQSLHANLITIGAEKGYYDFSDFNNPCGTNFAMRKEIITTYLSNRGISYSLDYCDRESDSASSKYVRDYTISKIKEGYPVLLSIRGDLGGHVAVAYDYNESSDQIYCHMGWSANETHVSPESEGFNVYKTATIIKFNEIHSHSNNYGVCDNDGDISYFCYDSNSIYTYSKPVVTYTYERYDKHQHIRVGSDGSRRYEFHAVSKSYGRYAYCDFCGEEIDMYTGGPVIRYSIPENIVLNSMLILETEDKIGNKE